MPFGTSRNKEGARDGLRKFTLQAFTIFGAHEPIDIQDHKNGLPVGGATDQDETGASYGGEKNRF